MASFVESLISETAPSDPVTSAAPAAEPVSTGAAAEPQQAEAAVDTPPQPGEQGSAPDPEFESLIEKLAKDEGLDHQNPDDRSFLERLAKREQRLLEAKPGTVDPLAGMTDFEKQFFGSDPEAKPAGQPAAEAPAAEKPEARQPQALQNGPVKYGDIGDEWKDWGDALKAESEAWGEVHEAAEKGLPMNAMLMQKVTNVRQAQFVRMADQILMPMLNRVLPQMAQAIAQKQIEQTLGDVVPDIRQTIDERRSAVARESALADLEKVAGFEKVRDLYKVEPGELKFLDPATGKSTVVPNTPLHRIFAQNPDLLNIDITHDRHGQILSSAAAERLTYTARVKAAHRIAAATRMNPQTAQTLLDAGKQVAARQQQDRFRHALNSGSGATTRGAGNEQKSLVGDFINANGAGPASFETLFK